MNYKEDIQTGQVQSWRRCYQVTVLNPFQQIPQIQFSEEDITLLPSGQAIVTNNTSVAESLSEGAKLFPLIHPDTGETLGQATYQEVYVMLFSLYMALATERDNPPVEEPIIEVDNI